MQCDMYMHLAAVSVDGCCLYIGAEVMCRTVEVDL
jgi:hypothetical protein